MTCPACGKQATGNYCANCGQRNGPRVLSFPALLGGLLKEQFDLDAKLPRTLRTLFFKPGLLTREYLAGRISPYVSPLRLYLWISVPFFLLVALKTNPQPMTASDRAVMDSIRIAVRDSASARVARGEAPRSRYGINLDPGDPDWARNAEVNFGNQRLNRAIKARLLTLQDLPPEEAIRRLMTNLIQDTPKVLFLLLPICALLLKLVYVRSHRYYAEHFVFALHAHAFAFGVFLLMTLATVSSASFLAGPLMLWILGYSLFALKAVYQEGWFFTTLKWLSIGVLYAVLLSVGLFAALAGAALTL